MTQISVLELDIRELENAIVHLNRSNEELLAVEEEDSFIIDAIAENKIALRVKHERLEKLQNILRNAKGGVVDVHASFMEDPNAVALTHDISPPENCGGVYL